MISSAVIMVMLLVTVVVWCNRFVDHQTKSFVYNDLNEIPANRMGLLLGTSKYLNSGGLNPFFANRIKAAAALYFSGKIRHLIVSGDNRHFSYNEPREMRKELMRAGIPDTCITLDFAGFRTLDSVIRGKKVFGQSKFTIISQAFHNQRAVYIARFHEIDAIGFNAEDPPGLFGLKVEIREVFARTMMMIDLFILHREPYFLGEAVQI
ncbi:hypothetical protein BH11BAC2_BH11BAC2_26120 [soil metagenome]